MAEEPDATAREAAPPSRAVILSSNTLEVGFIRRVYMFPLSVRAKRPAACAEFLNTYDVVA